MSAGLGRLAFVWVRHLAAASIIWEYGWGDWELDERAFIARVIDVVVQLSVASCSAQCRGCGMGCKL